MASRNAMAKSRHMGNMPENNKKPRRVTSLRPEMSQLVSQIVSQPDPLARVRVSRSPADLAASFPASFELFGAGLPAQQTGRAAGAKHALRVSDGCASTAVLPPPRRPRVLVAVTPVQAGRWSPPAVLDRIMEAVDTLGRVPMQVRPRGYANAMPAYAGDKMSIADQLEMMKLGELERRQEERNAVRLPPSTRAITRMDEAMGWILDHLAARPELARAVMMVALFEVHDINPKRALRRLGLRRRELYARSVDALELLARELNRAGVECGDG